MKNIFKLSFFALALFVLASCGSDDPKPISIVGKWTYNSASPAFEVDGKPLKDYLISGGMTEADAQAQVSALESLIPAETFTGVIGTIEFKSDGTFTGTGKDDNGDDQTLSGTYKITDNKNITITETSEPNDPLTGRIDSVTSSDLQLSILFDSDNSSGFKIDVYAVFKFKKA